MLPKLARWTVLFSALSILLPEQTTAFVGFQNPLKNPNGSDPFMTHINGFYYLTTTGWDHIEITRATTIAGLKTATPKRVWTDGTASRCCNMWAPELHQVDGV